MERIAVLSDIHGNLPALEAVVADAKARGCTGFADLGDILAGPLWPRETADYLIRRDWPTIAGNHERFLLDPNLPGATVLDAFARQDCTSEHHAWLAALPATMHLPGAWCTHARPGDDERTLIETELPGGGLVAASEAQIVARLGEERHPLVLHGHSHIQRLVTLTDGRRVANPGSVGLPSHLAGAGTSGTGAQYLILDGGEITMLRVPYDNEAAARRAETNGSPAWARMLREAPPR